MYIQGVSLRMNLKCDEEGSFFFGNSIPFFGALRETTEFFIDSLGSFLGKHPVYIYIYMHAVESKTGPIFAVSSVKNWSKFLCFFCF